MHAAGSNLNLVFRTWVRRSSLDSEARTLPVEVEQAYLVLKWGTTGESHMLQALFLFLFFLLFLSLSLSLSLALSLLRSRCPLAASSFSTSLGLQRRMRLRFDDSFCPPRSFGTRQKQPIQFFALGATVAPTFWEADFSCGEMAGRTCATFVLHVCLCEHEMSD